MKIVQISDFHFKPGRAHEVKQEQMMKKILDCKQCFKDVDLVFFTGDLVQDGSQPSFFIEANNIVLKSIINAGFVDESKIILCPGNHDVNRNDRINSIFEKIDLISTNEELNKFVATKDFEYSLKPIDNYYNFISVNYNNGNDEIKNKMFSAYNREINGVKTGIISINSAWRAVGMRDDNNLVFPTIFIEEALSYIKDCSFKILLMHHPLRDFKAYNSSQIEDILHNNFDLVLTGHLHKSKDSIDLTKNTGMINMGAPAALSKEHDAQLGIGTIEFDFEESNFLVTKFLFDKNENIVYPVEKGPFELLSEENRSIQNRFRSKLKRRYQDELEDSKNLFVSKENGLENKSFLEVCADPVLKFISSNEMSENSTPAEEFDWNNLNQADRDYIILGKGKCGKTILLKKILLDLLKNYSEYQTIPFYLDCHDFLKKGKTLDLESLIRRYYDINKNLAYDIVNSKKVLLLLDNYQSKYKEITDEIARQVEGRNNILIIACSDETTIKSIEDVKVDGRVFTKLFFHRLRKKHIKQLTGLVYNIPSEKQDEIVERINTIFHKLSIPFNFWTVSLFLWIFKKDLNSNFQNDVDLINLYIEKLLEKEQLTVDGKSFGFDKYKRYLAHFASLLLRSYNQHGYYISYPDLLLFTDEYLKKNPRYNISAKSVIDYIEDRDIIKKNDDEEYTFRLNGVFEYFVAHYMTIDPEFLENVVNDDQYYLSFSNEFELYAGFRRDDEDFLEKIYSKTKKVLYNTNTKYQLDSNQIDVLLKQKLTELTQFRPVIEKITEKLKNGLTYEEQDKIEEEILNDLGISDEITSDVRIKESKELNESIESLEKSLLILGSVFKNIDEINDQCTVYEIFDYVVNSTCNWGFKIIDEIRINDISELLKGANGEEAKELLKLITHIIPSLVQARLNDMIGHSNLERIIEERLKEYLINSKKNQYKIFLMTYLLCDINLKKHVNRIETLVQVLRLPVLKYSSMLKLNYYLGFKVNENRDLLATIKDLSQKQQISFDSDSDLGDIQKGFSRTQKTTLINKGK